MLTIQQLSEQYKRSFECKKRTTGEQFLCFSDHITPEHALYKLVKQAHNDMLPDDYKFQFIYDSLVMLSNVSSDLDADFDLYSIQIETDICNSDLLNWLKGNLNRIDYCNQILEEQDRATDFMQIVQQAQHREREEVLFSVYESLLSILEAKNNE
jgi:hypothetical protein